MIERCVVLRSNPGEVVFTPFMGVGSEVYIPVLLGRKGVGCELKPSYYGKPSRTYRPQQQVNDLMFRTATFEVEEMEQAA